MKNDTFQYNIGGGDKVKWSDKNVKNFIPALILAVVGVFAIVFTAIMLINNPKPTMPTEYKYETLNEFVGKPVQPKNITFDRNIMSSILSYTCTLWKAEYENKTENIVIFTTDNPLKDLNPVFKNAMWCVVLRDNRIVNIGSFNPIGLEASYFDALINKSPDVAIQLIKFSDSDPGYIVSAKRTLYQIMAALIEDKSPSLAKKLVDPSILFSFKQPFTPFTATLIDNSKEDIQGTFILFAGNPRCGVCLEKVQNMVAFLKENNISIPIYCYSFAQEDSDYKLIESIVPKVKIIQSPGIEVIVDAIKYTDNEYPVFALVHNNRVVYAGPFSQYFLQEVKNAQH